MLLVCASVSEFRLKNNQFKIRNDMVREDNNLVVRDQESDFQEAENASTVSENDGDFILRIFGSNKVHLNQLKNKSPESLHEISKDCGLKNAGNMLKQELLFSILKKVAEHRGELVGEGLLEVLSDGFGFLRSSSSNYLAGPDDIYVSPNQIRRFSLFF